MICPENLRNAMRKMREIVAAGIRDGDEQPDEGGPHRHGSATEQRPHHTKC